MASEWSASPWRRGAVGSDPPSDGGSPGVRGRVGKRSAAARSGAGRFWSRAGARISTDTRRASGPRADSAWQIERRVRHATGGEPGSRSSGRQPWSCGRLPIGMGRHEGTGGDAPARAIHWSAGLPGFEGAESLASPSVLHGVGWLTDLSGVDQARHRRVREPVGGRRQRGGGAPSRALRGHPFNGPGKARSAAGWRPAMPGRPCTREAGAATDPRQRPRRGTRASVPPWG